jgi:hypothetical protein
MQSNEHQDAENALDVVKLKAKAALLFALLSYSRQQLATLQEELEQELERRESAIRQLEARVREQEERIVGIMRSKSWRLTAPLRALKRTARRSR